MQETMDLQKYMATPDIITSICDWNAARYDQTYHSQLTIDLLNEEGAELRRAIAEEDNVEILDAYGDLFYVAIGGLWKRGNTPEDIVKGMDYFDSQWLPTLTASIVWLETIPHDSLEVDVALFAVALKAFKAMSDLLGSDDSALDVIRAICNSNDSKAIQKTEANIKANLNKGDNYVSPTKQITAIARARGLSVK